MSGEIVKNSESSKLPSIILVEYPAIVQNDAKMMESLGGIRKISETLTNEKRRLEASFLPKNVYAKPILADFHRTNGLLMKVKMRKSRKDPDRPPEISYEIMGTVEKVYKFSSLGDFQYLPIANIKTERKMIYNELMPQVVHDSDWLKSNPDIPFFLPPAQFNRLDNVQENIFKREEKIDSSGQELIGRTRNRSKNHVLVVVFDHTTPVPEKPNPKALEMMTAKIIPLESYNAIKDLFEKRPIWSRMALSFESKLPNDQLKFILPYFGYYYSNGPWRAMWVRFGYDPRKLFESRFYQILDYRLRNIVGIQQFVTIKRGYTSINSVTFKPKNSAIVHGSLTEPGSAKKLSGNKRLYNPYYECGQFPEMRQTFYQYCDVRVPKIQEMLEKIPTPLTGAVCNEKTGWLPAGFENLCRDIITEGIKNKLREMNEFKSDRDDEDQDESEDDSDINYDENEGTFDDDEEMDVDD